MRRELLRCAVGVTLLFGCSPVTQIDEPPPPDTSVPEYDEGFPMGWESWSTLTEAPILHTEDGEARELFYNTAASGARAGDFPEGAVLVKAQYRLEDGGKGPIKQLAVMIKGTGGEHNGWTFAVYDPASRKRKPFDPLVCAVCHSQRASNDYVFSDRSRL